MRYITIILITVIISSYSTFTMAAVCEDCYQEISKGERFCKECNLRNSRPFSEREIDSYPTCMYCYEQVSEGQKYCEECTLRFSKDATSKDTPPTSASGPTFTSVSSSSTPTLASGPLSSEKQLIYGLRDARKNYKDAILKLIQYYIDIGYQLRLKTARKELKKLNKVPQYKYIIEEDHITDIKPTENKEVANTLFHNGLVYKNSLNLFKKRERLLYAIGKFEKILTDYPESNKVDDAAFELAGIYDSFYFKDYEAAVYYYVKCYESNPETDKPARYLAGRIYDIYLKDFVKAKQHYEWALETCKVKDYHREAESRLLEFKKQGY